MNKYWVGGSGDWADGSHWSTSSGGAGGAGQPANADNVIFDANSFTGSCTVRRTASDNGGLGAGWSGCTHFDSSAVTGPLILNSVAGAVALAIAGDVYLKTTTFGGINNYFYGAVTHAINTDVTTAHTVSPESIIGVAQVNDGGTLSLGTKAGFGTIIFVSGTLTTNNKDFVCTNNLQWNPGGTGTLNLGSSNCYVFGFINANIATVTINAGTSTLYIYSVFNSGLLFYGPSGATWNNVIFLYEGSSTTVGYLIGFPCTIANLSFSAPANTRTTGIQFPASGTVTITSGLTFPDGTSQYPVPIQSTSNGVAATISKTTGTVTALYANIKDSTVSGGATFKATNSTLVSNTSGWTLVGYPPKGSAMPFLDGS